MVAVRGMTRMLRWNFVGARLRIVAPARRRWRKTPASESGRYKNKKRTNLKVGHHKCHGLKLQVGWLPAFLDFVEESFHFGGSADGNADEAWAHFARTVAEEDAAAFESCKESGAGGAEVGEEKISLAGESDDAKFLQSGGEGFAHELNA